MTSPTQLPTPYPYHLGLIHLATRESQSIGLGLNPWGSNAWPSANRANFFPFTIYRPLTVVSLFCFNGTTASGKFDLGIYSPAGYKIYTTGPVSQAGTHRPQTVVASLTLSAGSYLMAMAADNVTGQYYRRSTTGAGPGRLLGYAIQTTAFPLPEILVPEPTTQSNVFLFGLCADRPTSSL